MVLKVKLLTRHSSLHIESGWEHKRRRNAAARQRAIRLSGKFSQISNDMSHHSRGSDWEMTICSLMLNSWLKMSLYASSIGSPSQCLVLACLQRLSMLVVPTFNLCVSNVSYLHSFICLLAQYIHTNSSSRGPVWPRWSTSSLDSRFFLRLWMRFFLALPWRSLSGLKWSTYHAWSYSAAWEWALDCRRLIFSWRGEVSSAW